jgi:hypothetical protein
LSTLAVVMVVLVGAFVGVVVLLSVLVPCASIVPEIETVCKTWALSIPGAASHRPATVAVVRRILIFWFIIGGLLIVIISGLSMARAQRLAPVSKI